MVITQIRQLAPWWLRLFGVSERVADGYVGDPTDPIVTFTGLAIRDETIEELNGKPESA